MPWWIKKVWSCFWFRHGKVRYRIWIDEDSYIASASNGDRTVYNCYGHTPELAKEVALFKLQQTFNVVENERKFITKGNGYELHRIK